MLTSAQFDWTRSLALRLAGIELRERHRDLFQHRCQRRGIRDSAGVERLLSRAEAGDAEAARQLVGLLTTNVTGFFRHPRHFELAVARARLAVTCNGRARLWSAAAATGEEAWSLAIACVEAGLSEAQAAIIATDIDLEALAAARLGDYGALAMKAVSGERRGKFFRENSPQRWGVMPELRRLVDFQPANLAAADWPVKGPFEVIFCRNVLMYLEARHRVAALERMAAALAPEGLLLLDPSEHLGPAAHLFTGGAAGVYFLRPQGSQSGSSGVARLPMSLPSRSALNRSLP